MKMYKHIINILLFQYACAQYIIGYLTKNESGMSQLLKAINDMKNELSNMQIIEQIASVLDKNRELSIQESIYRALSLPMTKSSIKVKFVSTIHPHFRDGLLKNDLESIASDEPIFHKSLHQYYEKRYLYCLDHIEYEDTEKVENYSGRRSVEKV